MLGRKSRQPDKKLVRLIEQSEQRAEQSRGGKAEMFLLGSKKIEKKGANFEEKRQ